jgi:hypothetical protein
MFMAGQHNRPWVATTTNLKDIFRQPRSFDGEIRFATGPAAGVDFV